MIAPFEGVWPEIDATAFVHPDATVIGRVKIGPRSSIWPGVVLRGDEGPIVIGADTNVQDGTVVHSTRGFSEVVVGDRVTVGHRAILHGCVVGDDVLVGMGSTVLDNARLEAGSFLGACSLVTMAKVIPAGKMAMGNPAEILRDVSRDEQRFVSFAFRRYVHLAQVHRKELAALPAR